MKKHNLFTLGALTVAMLLSACEKDTQNSTGSNGEQQVIEGIPTYASVTISQNSRVGTYAADESTNLTGSEGDITNAYVLIFSGGYLEAIKELTLTGDSFSASFPVTTGSKQCFAIANVTDIPDNPDDKDDKDNERDLRAIIDQIYEDFENKNRNALKLDNIRSKVCAIRNINDATSASNFWMSNVYLTGQTDESIVVIKEATEEEVAAGKNNITILIGRMVSKVTPTFDQAQAVQEGGSLSNLSYRVCNNPKRFYLFPVYDIEEETGNDILISPYYDITTYDWSADESGYDSQKLCLGDFFSNGEENGTGSDGGNDEGTTSNPTFTLMGSSSYLTENSPKTVLNRKATMLSIRGTWTPLPDQVLTATGSNKNDELSQKTFARVQVIDSEDQILGYLPGVYDLEPSDLNSLNEVVAWKDVIGGQKVILEVVDDGETKVAQASGSYEDNSSVTFKLVFYNEGVCYYGYWLKQSIAGASIAQQYALKRNNHYKVRIKSVAGPGEPSEEDVVNKSEEVEVDSYMKATIEVMSWTEINLEGGI